MSFLPLQVDSDAKVAEVFKAVNTKNEFPAADAELDKLRLKGFEDKWERALFQGKELLPDYTFEECGLCDGAEITTVRVWLHAEGWQVIRRCCRPSRGGSLPHAQPAAPGCPRSNALTPSQLATAD